MKKDNRYVKAILVVVLVGIGLIQNIDININTIGKTDSHLYNSKDQNTASTTDDLNVFETGYQITKVAIKQLILNY